MPGFRVDKAFYYARKDSVVLAGDFVDEDDVVPGFLVELPAEVKGHGYVPISDITTVQFADDREQLCLVLAYEVFTDSPLLEFSDLEGLTLNVKPA